MSTVAEPAARVAAIAACQHGVITHEQLLAAGVSRATITRWAAVGHLHRLHRGVYAVGHANVTREGRLLAAVLACGEGAALSHSSACQLWGLAREIPGPIHVSVPRGCRRSPHGVIAHRPRALDEKDTAKRLRIPVTTATRTIFDQASTLGAATLRDQFEQADYLEILDRRRLAVLLSGARGRRGLGTLRTLMGEKGLPLDRTRSALERLFLRICRDHCLPLPAVNVPLLDYEVDFLWADARFVVEVDGGRHRGPQRDRDNLRDVRLSRAGYLVRRYSARDLADHSAVAAEIAAIIAERISLQS